MSELKKSVDDELKKCVDDALKYRAKAIEKFDWDKEKLDTQKALTFLSVNLDILLYEYRKHDIIIIREKIICHLLSAYPKADKKQLLKYLNKRGVLSYIHYNIIHFIIIWSMLYFFANFGLMWFETLLLSMGLGLITSFTIHLAIGVKFLRFKKVTS